MRLEDEVYVNVLRLAGLIQEGIALLNHSDNEQVPPQAPMHNMLPSSVLCSKLMRRFEELHEVGMQASEGVIGHSQFCAFIAQEAYYRRRSHWKGPPLVKHPQQIIRE